jgi:hypothetical protein
MALGGYATTAVTAVTKTFTVILLDYVAGPLGLML